MSALRRAPGADRFDDGAREDLRVIEGGAHAHAVLRSLTVTGFKSFPHRTQLEFAPGITAIVGPNGSGKSNLGEALRWALGEGSAKALRAKKSEELIFAGSETRRAIGMAEVVMHLDNSAGRLPIDFTEVEIARRFYRDGESEYLVNRSKVRLRDLQDLLAGAHLADNPFVVIGQGLVDQVLALRPAERRIVLEEAAGTRRLHLRREEALNKMRAAEAELLRVTDVLRELGPRKALLEEQAERWREYEAVRAELRGRALRWYRDSSAQSSAAREALRARLAAIDQVIATLTDQLSRSEALAQAGDEDLTAAREAEEHARRETEAAGTRAAEARERLAEARSAVASERAQRERAAEFIAAMRAESASLEHRFSEAESDARASAEACATATNAVARIEHEFAQRRTAVDAASAQRVAAERELLAREGAVGRTRSEAEAIECQLVETNDQIRHLAGELAGASREHDEARAAVTDARDRVAERTTRVEGLTVERNRSHAEKVGLNAELLAAQTHQRSVAEALERIVEEAEIVSRALSDERTPLGEGASWLLDVVPVPTELEAAVRALLGARPIVADGPDAVVRLWSTGLDAVTSIVPTHGSDDGSYDGSKVGPYHGVPTGLRLADLIEVSDTHAAVRDLLSRAYLIDDESAAMQRAVDLPPGMALVTRDGMVVTRGAIRLPAGLTESVRARRRLAELEELRSRLEHERSDADRSGALLTERRDAVATAFDGITADLVKSTTELDIERRGLSEAESRAASLQDRVRALDARTTALEAQRDQLRNRSVEVARDSQSAAAAHAVAAESFARAMGSEEREAAAYRDFEATATRARLGAATSEERRAALARLEEMFRDQLAALSGRLSVEEERFASLDALERTLAERRTAAEAEAARLAARSDELRAQWEAARDRARAAEVARRESEQSAAGTRERMAELRVERTRLAAEEERATAALRMLDEQVRAELGIADDEALPDPSEIEIEPASGGASRSEVKDLQRLRRRLMSLEPVNPLAATELADVGQRHDFLTAQKEDIDRAIAHLRALADDLAGAIAEQFSSTLEAVDREFAVFFTRLFAGGTASLRLLEEEDEAGIDILARPPGKRLSSLAQLSGGERALTATALLLAILRVKPAPFCLLDEVDAALDERNVGRFTEALRELTDHTQFVVITHNRGTIEAADTLYGVSMDASGVSKLVSLKLADLDKERAG